MKAIKRFTITIAAAALFAVPAQGASAAISAGERPLAQEMEHGVAQPSVEQGVSTSPGSTEPEAVESVPTPVDQGIGTSPGATEPAVTPGSAVEEQQAEEEDQDGYDDQACLELAQKMVSAEESAGLAYALNELFGGAVFEQWQINALTAYNDARVEGENSDCSLSEGETVE